jgi:hypothetical protein
LSERIKKDFSTFPQVTKLLLLPETKTRIDHALAYLLLIVTSAKINKALIATYQYVCHTDSFNPLKEIRIKPLIKHAKVAKRLCFIKGFILICESAT